VIGFTPDAAKLSPRRAPPISVAVFIRIFRRTTDTGSSYPFARAIASIHERNAISLFLRPQRR
jgi:hypothetical protein